MSVRGTSHARHHKKVVILEGAAAGTKIFCGWDDCDLDGFALFQVVINAAKPGFPRKLERYVFCTERHKQYWLNSHIAYGQLPSGANRLY